jgi:hypothetical protein
MFVFLIGDQGTAKNQYLVRTKDPDPKNQIQLNPEDQGSRIIESEK